MEFCDDFVEAVDEESDEEEDLLKPREKTVKEKGKNYIA